MVVISALTVGTNATVLVTGQTALQHRAGTPEDWSHHHLIFSNPGTAAQALAKGRFEKWYRLVNDPRYVLQQMKRGGWPRGPVLPPHRPPTPLRRDWNFSLQTALTQGGVAWLRYPAKYTFSPLAAASCASDFVIYGLNTAGGTSQANLVGVNNLYVGATGTGCPTITGPPTGGGSGLAPTPQVKWAFNVAASPINTSVVLSLDGTKVAYVTGGTSPVLQVLTLGSGGGTVTVPVSPSTTCGDPAPSICSVSLTSSGTDTYSSPFVDYTDDVAYVGDDTGHLYRITGVFTGTPALAGSPWPVSAGSTLLGPPVYDAATGTVFVGSQDGHLYGFTSSGSPISGSPLTLAANATASGGILPAAPVVDSTNYVLYAFYGDNYAGTKAGVAQVVYTSTPTFASSTTAALTAAGTNTAEFLSTSADFSYITDGAFSNSYYSSGPSATSWLYACGTNSVTDPVGVTLQQFGFSSSGILQATVHTVAQVSTTLTATAITTLGMGICSPLTEFYNTSTSTDWLFLSVPAQVSSNVLSYDITSEGLGGALMTPAAAASASGGASGIIVDGADSYANASSIYFTSQTPTYASCTTSGTASPANAGIGNVPAAVCAFKFTQSGLD
jgi:hypothetical protein